MEAQRKGWAASEQRLNDLESWCRLQACNLDTLSYEGRRLALEALGVVARIWSTDHDPRFDITLRLDVLPTGIAINDPRSDGDAAPCAGHVDGYTRRGCARRDGRRAGRLRREIWGSCRHGPTLYRRPDTTRERPHRTLAAPARASPRSQGRRSRISARLKDRTRDAIRAIGGRPDPSSLSWRRRRYRPERPCPADC